MKSKSLVLLAVAAGCGLVAMLGVQQMLSGGKPVEAKSKILVAKVDIDPGVPLEKTNVGFKEWPKDAIPEGAITKEEEFAERALKHRAVPGQPILRSALGKKGEFGHEIQIPEGMRLVSIPVNATMTHSGLLKPGSFVDVSATIEYPQKGGGKRVEVKTVLQCIQVFAVDDKVVGSEATADPANGPNKGVKNITFVVYPLQGQLLQLADKKSNHALVLAQRSKADKNAANTGDLTEQSMTALSQKLFGTVEDEESKPASVTTDTSKPKASFSSFVKRQAAPGITSVGDQALRRTWKIEVFQGDKKEIQEIDWPEESAAKGASPSGNSSNGWADPVMKFFSGRPKAGSAEAKSATEPKDAVEHRASSFIRRTPEAGSTPATDEQPNIKP